MSRKRSKEAMAAHREAFHKGARARGVDEETTEKIFQQVIAFSEFGFPKSPRRRLRTPGVSVGLAAVLLRDRVLRRLFNNQPMGFYSLDASAGTPGGTVWGSSSPM